jgi:hypothetical protein
VTSKAARAQKELDRTGWAVAKREEDKPDFKALSAQQADTDRLVRRLFGTAIADRYVDFCRLCSGRLPLKVSRPLAGHALRELDSSIRGVLAAPMDALPQEDEQQAKRRADALRALKDMKFDEETLQRADNALKPRLNHRTQIERIEAYCTGLTLAERLCRAADRINPAWVRAPHHCPGRGTALQHEAPEFRVTTIS